MIDNQKQYLIEYDKYKGPINLIVDLVHSKKVDIYQISLCEIISGFKKFIDHCKMMPIDTLSGFIWAASILLEIKSRSLLPSKKTKDDSEEEPDESLLKRRENEYRSFKKIANYFRSVMETEELFLVREAPLEKEYMDVLPDLLGDLKTEDIFLTASRLLKGQPVELEINSVYNHRNIRSINDEIERVKHKLNAVKEITFKELSGEFEKVIDIIICFLSILELYKNEEVEILQFENFGNIIIRKI